MLGSMDMWTGDWMDDLRAGPYQAWHTRLRRTVAGVLQVSPWEWAGRIGWTIGAAYAATAIVWAILRSSG